MSNCNHDHDRKHHGIHHVTMEFVVVPVACDYLWFTRNKAHHDGIILNALIISATINKTTLEHYSARTTKYDKTLEVWKSPSSSLFQDKL